MTLNELSLQCYTESLAAGWWPKSESVESLTPVKLLLIHSEISEAVEGHRKQMRDEKLPHRSALEVELADALIRICDLAGAHNYDLDGAVREKMQYNRSRADHKPEAREAEGGKRY